MVFTKGQWAVICDRCGFEYKSVQLRQQWNNLRCCSGPGTNECWEARNQQESVRGKRDDQMPSWVRPVPPEVTLSANEVTPEDL